MTSARYLRHRIARDKIFKSATHIQSPHLLHIIIREGKIKNCGIFRYMLRIAGTGNGDIIILYLPAQHDLSVCLAMPPGDFLDGFILQHFLRQRIPPCAFPLKRNTLCPACTCGCFCAQECSSSSRSYWNPPLCLSV